MNDKKQPETRVRIGAIAASIWKNDGKNGSPFYTVTFERLYRTANGDWEYSKSFGRGELLELAKAADQAHDAVLKLQAQDRAEAKLADAVNA